MNVKNKVFTVVIVVILSLSCFFVVQGIRQHNREREWMIEKEEQVIDGAIADIQSSRFLQYRVRIGHIIENNSEVREAFADRNRDRLYRLVLPLYRDLIDENEHFHAWDFNLPDGTVFLRVQKPELHGDNIGETRKIVRFVHDTGEPAAGYDIGKHGAIFWVVHPVFHRGRYAGAMEFGIPVDHLVRSLEERFRTEVTTIIRAERWGRATFMEESHRRFGDNVLMTHPGSVYGHIPDDFVFTADRDQKITLGGKDHILHNCFRLKSFDGETIGGILVLQDISEHTESKRRFVISSLAVTIALTGISFAFLYMTFNTLIGRLESYARETKEAKEEAEKARGELAARVEERTRELNEAYVSLNEQHRFMESIIESLTHPFYVIDARTYEIVLANNAALSMYRGERTGLTCFRMTHNRDKPCTGDEHPCSLLEVKRTKRPQILEHVHTGGDGLQRVFEIYAYPLLDGGGEVVKVIEYAVDVTERKRAEEEREKLKGQLQQAQKMEAMGTLAGGIAHDFNNILSAIFGYTDLMRYELPQESAVQKQLDEVLKAADRAKGLVKQILAFSRKAEQEREPFQIHLMVKEVLKLMRASIPTTIEIRQDVADCGLVLADPTHIHQIIMNLCTNAYHAMREKGGVLAVAMTQVEVSEEDHKAAALALIPGRYVKLEVSDTGHGMDRSTVDKIFDPYFTTKKKGEGTGLGLAVVHGIVKSHGGHITVYSEPGTGTTFNVYLPKFEPEAGEPEATPADEVFARVESLPGGGERILLVDDEEQIVEVERQMLESLGYRVEAFSASPDALEAFESDPEGFDLVFTDMTMPSLTGVELAGRIRSLRPEIPIILSTGFSEMISEGKAKAIGIRKLIMKPLVKADLAMVVRKVLDSVQL